CRLRADFAKDRLRAGRKRANPRGTAVRRRLTAELERARRAIRPIEDAVAEAAAAAVDRVEHHSARLSVRGTLIRAHAPVKHERRACDVCGDRKLRATEEH